MDSANRSECRFPQSFFSEKTIPGPLQWSVPNQSDGYIRIYTPLEIDGVLEAGTVLIGGADAPGIG